MSQEWDALNRIKTRTYTVAVALVLCTAAWCYDGKTSDQATGACAGNPVTGSLGKLTSTWTAASATECAHDAEGRVQSSGQRTPASAATAYTFQYGYYADDSLASVTYPSGRKLTTCYDALGRPVWVSSGLTTTDCTSLPAVLAAAGSYYASMAQYAPHGGLKSLRYGNGLFEGATFNSRQQPESLTLGASENASDRWRQQYDFLPGGDAAKNNGNVRKLTLTLPGRSPFDTHFTYDALNRLAGVLENPAVPLSGCVAGNTKWCQQFSYDEMGNRAVVAEQGLGAQLGRPASFAKSNNRITDAGWGYDARGNVNAIPFPPGTDKFLYDAENRLVTHCKYAAPAETCSTDDVAASRTVYRYDAEGRRVKREQPGQATVFAYDAFGNLAAEYGTAASGAAGRSYLTTDHLGSTRVISDESGTVRERHDYQPFGLELAFSADNPRVGVPGYGVDAATPLKFTGKERDGESGLDYFGARYFSGAQGRFTTPDPENANAMVSDPQSWNMYAYGRNNPLSYVDPDGLAYRVCQADENGKESNCTTQKNELSDKQFEQFKKDNKGSLIFAGGKVYGINEDGSRGSQTGTYMQTDVDIDNPAFGAVAQGMQAASPVTDPRFIAGFYGASALSGLALYGGGAFAGGQLTTLGLQTGAATEGSTALAGTLNLSKHAVQRMAERGFTRDMIQATIKNGTRYWDPKNGTFNYVLRGGFAGGKDALVGMNPVTNVVTTVLRGTANVKRMIPF